MFQKIDKFFDKLSNIILIVIVLIAIAYVVVTANINFRKEIVKDAIREYNQEQQYNGNLKR